MASVVRCDFCKAVTETNDPEKVSENWLHITTNRLEPPDREDDDDEDEDEDEWELIERSWDFCSPECLMNAAEIMASAPMSVVREEL